MRGKYIALVFAVIAVVAVPIISWSASKDAETLVVEAEDAAELYQIEKAISLYTQAINSGDLSVKWLAAAYAGRGQARRDYTIAYGIKDEELALALADYRKARDLRPDEWSYHSVEAGVLIMLGGYEEAMSVYREMYRLERPYPHWTMIGFARVERIQKRYDAALKHLDELVKMSPDEGGTMPIHYHRGRTLYLKGDFVASAQAFTDGIPKQPNYAYAYVFRACANARAGALTQAVADIDRASHIFKNSLPNKAWENTPYGKSDQADLARDIDLIKAMAAGRASAAEGAVLCKQTWNDGDQLRERSPLIGVDSSKIARRDMGQGWRPASASIAAQTCSGPECEH